MHWKPANKKSPMTQWMPEWLRLSLKVCFRLGLIGLLLFSLLASYYYYQARKFDLGKVAEEQRQSVLLDTNGLPLLGSGSKQDSLVTKDALPPHLIDALIAREDAKFETHCGVNFKGLLRATVRNAKDMSFTQGASTLTMQLARNTFDIQAKSLNRKFLEIALTLRIEHQYSKPEILAYYLNRIYFGSGCYGIKQAAKKYFKTPTSELDLSESATLVGIIREPHIFSPLRNSSAAQEQRDQVLDRMVAIEKLSQTEADAIKATPLVLPKLVTSAKKNKHAVNGYALRALDRHLNEVLESKDIRSGNLTITSSFDLRLLHQCENSIKQLIQSAKIPELQAACVVLNHETGAILSLVGGSDYSSSQFDRALDSQLDLGEAFTPFIYAAALERNKLPIKGKPVQTGRQLDISDTQRIARRFGFSSPFNLNEIFYGSGVTTPLELTTAFATLSNKGIRPHTYFVQNIIKNDDSILFENTKQGTPAVQAGTARETLKLLKQRKGSYQHTCYAFGGRALWSMSTKGERTAVLWVGFDKAKPVPEHKKILKKMEQTTLSWVN